MVQRISGPGRKLGTLGVAIPVIGALLAVQLFANITADLFTTVLVAGVAYAAGRLS